MKFLSTSDRPHSFLALAALGISTILSLACSDDSDSDNETLEVDAGADAGSVRGEYSSCVYENAFTGNSECKDYLGAGWDTAAVEQDCTGVRGVDACDQQEVLGTCLLDAGEDNEQLLVFPGSDASACGATELGCETFAGGEFEPSDVCSGAGAATSGGIGTQGALFTIGELECQAPLEGEEPGTNDGEVCTRSMISACSEPGRKFTDYASCEPVLTQRPYAPVPAASTPAADDDPRLENTVFLEELEWVKEQVEACACVCCHDNDIAPAGASNWDIDAGPLWIDTFFDSGLAMIAGWVDSSSFGAFPPEDNNGFSRDRTGLPTTDVERLKAFFEQELERRGVSQETFADTAPFGGPIYQQSIFEPAPCETGQGVDDDGALIWTGGPARYLYVLEEGSANPGVPPNLDKPEGTIWKIEVPVTGDAVASGLSFGELPDDFLQSIPEGGISPNTLSAGETYYLVVLADIGIPITRCLFTL